MSDPVFVDITFEGISTAVAEDLVVALGDTGLYEHIAGNQFNFIGALRKNKKLSTVERQLQQVIWDHNGGLLAEVKEVDRATIDHLL